LLLSSKDKIPPIFNALALRFAADVFVFGNVIRGEVAGVIAALALPEPEAELPRLIVLEPTDDPLRPAARPYKGKYVLSDLDRYLRRYEQRDYGVPQMSLNEFKQQQVDTVSPSSDAFLRTECDKQRCVLLLVPSPGGGQANAEGVASVDDTTEIRIAAATETVRTWRTKYTNDPVSFALARADELAGWRAAFGADASAVMLQLNKRRFAVCTDADVQLCSISLVDRMLGGGGGSDWHELPAGLQFL
jgi:hypothetical protein